MQFAELYEDTITSLENAGIENAQFDAILLFDFCFGFDRSKLILSGDEIVPEGELAHFRSILKRRLSREPLQYITGVREFWSLDFIVSPSVLIPRPETEFLLERVLEKQREVERQPGRVLDMCTGSGVIAVVLARELHGEEIVAVDSSYNALEVAAMNRKKFEMTNQIHLLCSDLFSCLRPKKEFKLIVANPPYIAASDHDTLQPEVRVWEPRSALLAGSEGLDVIVQLADEAYKYMCLDGWIFVEIGADQKDKVEQLFVKHWTGVYDDVEVVSDLSGLPRVLQARKAREVHE